MERYRIELYYRDFIENNPIDDFATIAKMDNALRKYLIKHNIDKKYFKTPEYKQELLDVWNTLCGDDSTDISQAKYLVFKCYYKHGEASVYPIDDLFHFCEDDYYSSIFEEYDDDVDIIKAILQKGSDIITEQIGSGVVGIVDLENQKLYSDM